MEDINKEYKENNKKIFKLSYNNIIYDIYIEKKEQQIIFKYEEYFIELNKQKLIKINDIFLNTSINDIYDLFCNLYKNNNVKINNIITKEKITLLFQFLETDENIKIDLIYNNNEEFINNDSNLTFYDNISTDAYGCSVDNIFITFKSKSNIIYLVYSNLKKSIIAYNLNKMQIEAEIKKAHNDYIDNFRYSYNIKNKKDIILSLSSGDNNIKIWDINNWECIYNLNNIYKVGIILSACFLINENINYIITCNCFLYDIMVIDFNGNKIKQINNSSNYTIFIDTYFDIQQSKYYIITGNKNNVKSYDYHTNEHYKTYSDNFSTHHRSIIIYDDNAIVKIIFPCEEGFIRIFNFHSGILLKKININNEGLIGISLWNKDNLFVGCKNKSIKLIDLKKEKIIKNFIGHNHWVCSLKKIKTSNLGECLITQALDNKIKLWSIQNNF